MQISSGQVLQPRQQRSFLPGFLGVLGMLPGPQQPFVQAAAGISGLLSGQGGGSVSTPAQTVGGKGSGADPFSGAQAEGVASPPPPPPGLPSSTDMLQQSLGQTAAGLALPQAAQQQAQAQAAAQPPPPPAAAGMMQMPSNPLMAILQQAGVLPKSGPLGGILGGMDIGALGKTLSAANNIFTLPGGS